LAPSCVATCPAEALRFGTTDDLAAVAESVRVAGELSPALFVVPSRQAWDANAFHKVLSRAAEPSVPTALTVIVER
jgi:Fe-S-cluster-containing dehydrogenase component